MKTELKEVCIQLHTACNRECSFCCNKDRPLSDVRFMPIHVFKKCMSDLKDMNYSGALGLFLNNEPLFAYGIHQKEFNSYDIINHIRYARLLVPKAKLFIITNGDYLDAASTIDLFGAGLDLIIVSVYEDMPHPGILKAHSLFPHKVRIDMRRDRGPETLHNYSGAIKSGVNQTTSHRLCALPFKKCVVSVNGDVGLCCVDFFNEITFGNVMDKSIRDIFFGKTMSRWRSHMKRGRFLHPCNKCSYSGDDYDIMPTTRQLVERFIIKHSHGRIRP